MQGRIELSKFPWPLDPHSFPATAANPFKYDPEEEQKMNDNVSKMVKDCMEELARKKSTAPTPKAKP